MCLVKHVIKGRMDKCAWYDARKVKNQNEVLTAVYHQSFSGILLSRDQYDSSCCPAHMKKVVEIFSEGELDGLSEDTIVIVHDETLLKAVKKQQYDVGYYINIENRADMDYVCKIDKNFKYLILEFADVTNIPLELMIANNQKDKIQLFKKVNSIQDMKIAFAVMEVGCDGVLFSCEDVSQICNINEVLCREKFGKIELVVGKVVEVEHISIGQRDCIDCVSEMTQQEGFIIGSTSSGGLLVSSETHELPYMKIRPFRVNAGAIHSYVWNAKMETNYLSELEAGSELLCVDTNGNTRPICVGRIKCEYRPMLKVVAEANGVRVNAIVQDDWHIRIFGADKEPKNASLIKPGDELLVYLCDQGRHMGISIEETITEK